MRALLLLALAAAPALAQRPDEDALFGGPAADTGVDAGTAADAPAPAPRPDEAAMFGGAPEAPADGGAASPAPAADVAPDRPVDRDVAQLTGPRLLSRFDTDEEKSDPLKIGGTLYLRGQANVLFKEPFEKSGFQAPMLLDAYLDARPTDRVRGFALGRLRYDPTYVAPSQSLLPGVPTIGAQGQANPAVFLDQLWMRFDLFRTVFFTVGRQKAKWGSARLWTPTDFLNQQQRDPLQPFDLRLGINAVKVHVPIESLGWNFYGYGLLDNAGPANVLGNLGGALRAEFLIKQTEIGLGGVWVNHRRPRYAVDISSALGPIDVYGEAAFRDARDFRRFRLAGDADFANPAGLFEEYRAEGLYVQATVGASFTFNYTDAQALTIGAEYFHNPPGYDSPVVYPWLLYQGDFNPLYLGRHYVGFFILAPGLPGDLDWVTLSLTGLLNASDPSGIVRLDAFLRVLSYLQVELFGSVNFGVKGGEFRFGIDLPPFPLPDGSETPRISSPYPAGSFGVGLRVAI